ncbi:hypothetical protein RQP54_17670 [Curvibacter sp. APW13]|uniref:hypothetical protein n=1 Tax=Curvibacter sp. APW13 TaxID=3077236 RepID=UPI0028DE8D20|nr:hypothetical protein [Curvibacter sp. APW13]MDT8992705.1 hypothetical protein [Curvibacter sp. APW13]
MKQTEGAAAGPDKAADWVDRSHRLMAWAVTAAERRATYIGSLRTDQTGLACQCVCPACGGQLQAVNAGKSLQDLPAGKSLRPHFRHHTGQQQDSCLVRTSQLVALQLLVQEKVIHLPAQTSRWTVGGASGQMYTGTATSAGFAARIVERQWVDEHEAKITLDNGRVVWLRLFGTTGVGVPDSGDGVVTVQVDDPEVATWPIEKILQYAQLTGAWMCWEKHWQDSELEEQARMAAEKEAQHWCDQIPPDLDLPEGLTHAQRSESVLHWLIKGILEKAQYLATPDFHDTVTRYMPDQDRETRGVYLEEKVYRISNARLEHRLQGVIPDVICTASHGQESMELMIEVAVTHKVDHAKSARIRSLGLACMEIDTQRLGKSGRTTVDELRAMVLNHTKNKTWIFHPEIENRRRSAEQYLAEMYAEQARDLAEEQARTEWLRTLNDEDLLQEYLQLLRQIWAGHTPRDSQGRMCLPTDLVNQLEERKFRGMDATAITVKRGLLWMLDAIVNQTAQDSPVALLEEAMTASGPIRLESYVTIIGAAINMYAPPVTTDERERMQKLRGIIKQSVALGEATYTRTTQYDRAMYTLFPLLQEPLQTNKGTQEVASRVRLQRHMQQREQEQKQRELQEREQATREREEELRTRFDEISLYYGWMPREGWPHDLATTEKHVGQSTSRNDIVRTLPWTKVLESAWQAREAGHTLTQWLQAQSPKSVYDIDIRLRLLQSAWMLHKKKPQRVVSR